MRTRRLLCIVSSAVLLLSGCGPSPDDRASQLIAAGAHDQAITLLDSEITKHPRDSRLFRLLGDALFASAARTSSVLDGGDQTGRSQAKADELMRKALSAYSSAKNLAPADPVILYHRALALLWCNDPQVRAAFEQLLVRNPKHPGKQFFAMSLRGFGENVRADSIDTICAREAKVQGEWVDLSNTETQMAGAFIALDKGVSAREVSGGATVSLEQFAVFDCIRDSANETLHFELPRSETRQGWMLQTWLVALVKDPRIGWVGGPQRKERFIVYEEPTLKIPDEYANSNWTRMPTVDVDRNGRELLSDEALRTVTPQSEVRTVRYPGGIGGLMPFSTDLRWQRVTWVETVPEPRVVDASRVVFTAMAKPELERKQATIEALNLQGSERAAELLKGKLARGLTLRMAEGAVGPLQNSEVGWSDDVFILQAAGAGLPGHRLKFEDGTLASWE